jgi:MFS family permease
MGAHVLHAFGSGVCEALPVQLVNDIFFIHERGKKPGWYTAGLWLGATGPLYAGYMLAGGYSWPLFFYVEFALTMALLIAAVLSVEGKPCRSRITFPNAAEILFNPRDVRIQIQTRTFIHVRRKSYVGWHWLQPELDRGCR